MTLERFSGIGLEVQRLGQGRIEVSAMAAGSMDTLVVGGVDLLPGGAVAFDTSIAQTLFNVAAVINALTSTHGFQAYAGISDTEQELVFYQVVPGLLADSAVTFTFTTATSNYIRPTGFADNELFGDTDDFSALEDVALHATDVGAKFIVRVASGAAFQPTTLINKGTGGVIFDTPVQSGGVTRYITTVADVADVSTLPKGYTFFESGEQHLPIKVWQKGGFRGILSAQIDAVFAPSYLIAA